MIYKDLYIRGAGFLPSTVGSWLSVETSHFFQNALSRKLTNISPVKIDGLEDEFQLFGARPIFTGENVSFREDMSQN